MLTPNADTACARAWRGPFETIRDAAPTGIGLGLRWSFIDQAHGSDLPEALRFFEVSPENYVGRGGHVVSRMEAMTKRRRLITHGLMMDLGGNTDLAPGYLKELGAFMRRLGVNYHSDHLCFSGWDGRVLHDLLPLPRTRAGALRISDRIKRVQDGIGLPMAVENISSYLGLLPPPLLHSNSVKEAAAKAAAGGHGQVVARQDTDFLNEVVELADCGILLDVNNVFVNATNFGFDPYEFLREVPLHRVVQLHVAGGERRAHLDRLLIDTHGADVSDEVAAMMAWVVERIGALPVLYERDNQIPPFAVLMEQVQALDVVYRAALAHHEEHAAQHRPAALEATAAVIAAATGSRGASEQGPRAGTDHLSAPLDLDEETVFDDLSQWVVRRGHEQVVGAILARAGNDEVSARTLLSDGAHRPTVYRTLVRSGLADVVRQFLPRTRARMGQSFDEDFALWFEEVGPSSRILREVPMEFFAWAGPRWRQTGDPMAWLIDLARHELLEFIVAASTNEAIPSSESSAPLDLDRPVRMHVTARLVDYGYAVHELDIDLLACDLPTPRRVQLLVYRDANDEVRYLELSLLAGALAKELLDGRKLSAAVASASESSRLLLDGETLSRVSELLADLSERGVVLGAA